MTQQRTFPENVSQPTALGEIRARLEAATPGPWEVDRNHPFTDDLVGIFAPGAQKYVLQVEDQDDVDDPTSRADARFIAHARTDVTRLLNALQAIQEFALIAEELCDMNRSPRNLASVPVVQIRNAIAAALEVE